MSIFKLVGDIFVNNEKANKNLDETDKKGQGVGKTFQKGIKTIGSFGKVLGGAAIAGGAAMIALGKKTGDAADRLLDLSSITGMSTDELQKWEKVSTVAGVSTDAISNISQKLTKQMDILATGTGKASEAAESLGLSYENLSAMNADERMNALVSALQGVEDPTERAKLGTDLLGGSWKELAPILDVGAERLAEVKENANIISNDDLNQANEFRIKMDQMKEKAIDFAQKLAVQFIPILNKLFDWFNNNAPIIETVFTGVMNGIKKAIDFIVPIIQNYLIPAFMAIAGWVNENLPAIQAFFEEAFTIISELFDAFVTFILELWNNFGDEFLLAVEYVWETIKNAIQIAVDLIKGVITLFTSVLKGDWKAAWDAIKDIVTTVWDGIKLAIEVAIDLLKTTIESGLNLIKTVVENIFNGIKSVITGIWDSIVDGIKSGINVVIDLINGMIEKLNEIDIDLPFTDNDIDINVSKIPRLQTGGTITKSGIARVGEIGPENVFLPEGASVVPLNKQGMMGNVTVVVKDNTLLGEDDEIADKLGTIVVDRLRELGVRTT